MFLLLLSASSYGQELYKITAYSHGCTKSKADKGKPRPATDTSWPVPNKTIATDWEVIKPGTEVIIEGIGIWKANDRSGSIINGKYVNNGRIKGNSIDLFVGSCKFAKEWVRYLRVWKVPAASTKWSNLK